MDKDKNKLIPLEIDRHDEHEQDIPRLSLAEFEEQVAAFLGALAGDTSTGMLVYDGGSGTWLHNSSGFHKWEDAILIVALRAIAEGAAEPAQWAAGAMAAVNASYDRWYE